MLSENTASATKGVIENFETLNRTAGTESRKASDAVREANRSLIEEITSAITEASKRFAEATREMRGATRELQRDLEETRGEIKKGVLDLPEEARESTEAMRRVVGDQIKALTELSEIISRHGKTIDISSPALGEPRLQPAMRQVEAPQVAIAAAAGGQSAPIPEIPSPAATLEAAGGSIRTAEIRRTGNANGNSAGNVRVDARPSPIRNEAPRANPPPLRPTPLKPTVQISRVSVAPPSDESGWVSDLLRRASRDDEDPLPPSDTGRLTDMKPASVEAPAKPPSAPAPVEVKTEQPLGALSMDIARAIDHDASIELWERHRRGERNVFTRRLYTLQGQQTFDEIRRKYQRDDQFRAAVDRYVSDFEKLLAEVTRTKDRATSNAYLISDTGKVYTLLAHASGRLE